MEATKYFADIILHMREINEKAEAFAKAYGFHAELKADGKLNTYVIDRTAPGCGAIVFDENVDIFADPIGAIVTLSKAYGYIVGGYAAKNVAKQPEVEFGPLEEVKKEA